MNKVIHYFWFGKKEKPRIFKTCLKSWKKYLPNWEIKEWNETNINLYKNEFTRFAYDNGNWSLLSDYFRVDILEQYGGLYFDVDVEVIGDLSSILDKKEPFLGFELSNQVASGLIMYFPEPHNKCLQDLLNVVESKLDLVKDTLFKTTMVNWVTDYFVGHGLIIDGSEQIIEGIHIYPADYFCPINPTWHIQKFTSNTRTIHHYLGSWYLGKDVIIVQLKRVIFKFLHPINYIKLLKARHL